MSCMLLATFRAEYYPLWLDQPHVTMLTLNRLRRDDTAAMLAHITRGKALPRDVYDQILSKTDGIPLFVEELTRAVIETGLLQEDNDRFVPLMPLQALTIPMTLQESADGAARPAGPGQGNRPNRRRARPRILLSPHRRGG